MSDMSETVETDNTIILAGRVIQFIPPTQGQVEQMVRIARSTQRGDPDQGPRERGEVRGQGHRQGQEGHRRTCPA
jgi:hypothetical protein